MALENNYQFLTAKEIQKLLDVAETEAEYRFSYNTCNRMIAQYREIMHEINPLRIKAKLKMRDFETEGGDGSE